MIIKTVSKIKKIILSIFIAFLLLLFLGYFFLTHGITLQNLHVSQLSIGSLYLKLDKKIILDANNITLAPSKKSTFSFDSYLYLINYIPKLFEKISLHNIHRNGAIYNLQYANNHITLQSDLLKGSILLYYKDKKLYGIIEKISVPTYNLHLTGRFTYVDKNIHLIGTYNAEGIKGPVRIDIANTICSIWLQSKPFENKNLAKLFSHIPINKDIKNWSYKYIVAKKYRLVYLKGRCALDRPIDINNFTALATAEDATIRFNPKLPSAFAKKIVLLLKNDTLFFKLKKPRYGNKKLDGSSVTIYKVGKRGSYITIQIKTKSMFDKEIKRLLRAYNIQAPIVHKKGSIDAKVGITILFTNFKTDVTGEFFTKDALLTIKGIDLHLHNTTLKLHNTKMQLLPSTIGIEDSIHTYAKGTIDFATMQAKFFTKIKDISIKQQGFVVIEAKNIADTLTIDLKNEHLHLKNLDVNIDMKDGVTIKIANIKKILPYTPLLQKIHPLAGDLTLHVNKSIQLSSHLTLKQHILQQRGKFLNNFTLTGTIQKTKALFRINDIIKIKLTKDIVANVRNVTIFFPSSHSAQAYTIKKKIFISFHNCVLAYKKHRFLMDSAQLQIDSKGFTLLAKYKNGNIKIENKIGNLTIKAKNLDDIFIAKLFGVNFLQEGSFSIDAIGNETYLTGRITLSHTYIKNFQAFNNLFAFINTIPSLVTLQNPGFNTHGLFIEDGTIDFIFDNIKQIVIVKKLHLISNAITFDGVGIVDLKHKKIDMNIELATLKPVSNIVKNIPIAGYILLGKNGTLSTTLKLSGNLDNPTVTTQMAKDTLTAPLNILKRTLTLPFHLF